MTSPEGELWRWPATTIMRRYVIALMLRYVAVIALLQSGAALQAQAVGDPWRIVRTIHRTDAPDVLVFANGRRLMPPQKRIARAQVVGDSIVELSSRSSAKELADVLASVKAKRCREIPGLDQTEW